MPPHPSSLNPMYLGNMVEIADYDKLHEKRYHPYTEALLSAIPQVDQGGKQSGSIWRGGSQSGRIRLRLPVPYTLPQQPADRRRQESAPVKGSGSKGILWPATCIRLHRPEENTEPVKDCNMGDTARTLASQ